MVSSSSHLSATTLQLLSPPNPPLSGASSPCPFFLSFSSRSYSAPTHLRRRSLNLPIRPVHCASATPPPPPSEPEDGVEDPNAPTDIGLAANFSKSQESARIFFAVFFWLSLFFWASAWDGRNDGGPKNRSHFRR